MPIAIRQLVLDLGPGAAERGIVQQRARRFRECLEDFRQLFKAASDGLKSF
jgi:hypothetical protein